MFFKKQNKEITCNQKFADKIKEDEFKSLVGYLNAEENGFAEEDFEFELEDNIFILYPDDQQALVKEKLDNIPRLLEIDDTIAEYIILAAKKDGQMETVHMISEED